MQVAVPNKSARSINTLGGRTPCERDSIFKNTRAKSLSTLTYINKWTFRTAAEGMLQASCVCVGEQISVDVCVCAQRNFLGIFKLWGHIPQQLQICLTPISLKVKEQDYQLLSSVFNVGISFSEYFIYFLFESH